MDRLETVQKVHETQSFASTAFALPLVNSTIRDHLDEKAVSTPDKVAYIFNQNDGLQITFADLKDRAYRMAQNFLELGLKKGDRVAVLFPNTHELLISYFATAVVGIINVPLDPDYGSFELEYMLKKTEPSAIMVYNHQEYKQIIEDLFPETGSHPIGQYKSERFPLLKKIIFLDPADKSQKAGDYKNTYNYVEIANSYLSETRHPLPYVDIDDTFAILFTSGTTSRPKGITLNQFSVVNNGYVVAKFIGEFQGDSVYCQTPLMYHVGTMTAIMHVVVRKKLRLVFPSYKLDVKDILESIQKYKCTAINGLPKILLNVLNYPNIKDYDLSSVYAAISGGQLITTDLIMRLKNELKLRVIFSGYGMTETIITHVQVYMLHLFTPEQHDNSIGKPIPYCECKIIDPNTGEIVPHNTEGQICVRSFSVTKQFWNDEAMTRKMINQNGWLITGDYGLMKPDGSVKFVSRDKEIITARGSGRLDVYHSEVEDVLLKHEGIDEAVVFGVPVTEFEQEVCAWIRTKPNTSLTVEEVKKFTHEHLVDFKVPKFIKFVHDFPLTRLGKYLRSEMAKQYKAELGDLLK